MQLLRVLTGREPESTRKTQSEVHGGESPVARRVSCCRGFQTPIATSVLDRSSDGSVGYTEKHLRRRRSVSVTSPHYAYYKAERVRWPYKESWLMGHRHFPRPQNGRREAG